MRTPTIAVVLALLATGTLAQSDLTGLLSGLSNDCRSAVTSLISSPIASCLQVSSALPIATTQGSVVAPLNTWFTAVCGAAPCSNSTLADAKSTIDRGCASDKTTGGSLPAAADAIITNYGTIRSAVCLKSPSTSSAGNSDFCITQSLTGVEKDIGQPLTLKLLESLFADNQTALAQFSRVQKTTLCTDCNKALFTQLAPVVRNATGGAADQSVASTVSNTCGASFIDGKLPSTVSNGTSAASAASANSPNGALGAPLPSWFVSNVVTGAGLGAVFSLVL